MSRIARYNAPTSRCDARKTPVTSSQGENGSRSRSSSFGEGRVPKQSGTGSALNGALSPRMRCKQSNIVVKRAAIKPVAACGSGLRATADDVMSGSDASTSSSSSNVSSSHQIKTRLFTNRSKMPARHSTFGKGADGHLRAQAYRNTSDTRSNKRDSLESETASSSDYYEETKIVALSQNSRLRPLNSPRMLDLMSEDSDCYPEAGDISSYQSDSTLGQNTADSESDSQNYEEITDYRSSHSYEQLDEYLPETPASNDSDVMPRLSDAGSQNGDLEHEDFMSPDLDKLLGSSKRSNSQISGNDLNVKVSLFCPWFG